MVPPEMTARGTASLLAEQLRIPQFSLADAAPAVMIAAGAAQMGVLRRH